MEYIMAPMKGSMSSRILFGHLLGFGLRQSRKGSGFLFGGKSDMHLRGAMLRRLHCGFGRNGRRSECWSAWLWGSSRAPAARNDSRKGGMAAMAHWTIDKGYGIAM